MCDFVIIVIALFYSNIVNLFSIPTFRAIIIN